VGHEGLEPSTNGLRRPDPRSPEPQNIGGTPQAYAQPRSETYISTPLAQGGCSTDATAARPEPRTLERLSRALEAAALAGKWDVVRRLTDALERLQGAERGDAAVVGLDAFRGRKGRP
jgi:hypothetical protein